MAMGRLDYVARYIKAPCSPDRYVQPGVVTRRGPPAPKEGREFETLERRSFPFHSKNRTALVKREPGAFHPCRGAIRARLFLLRLRATGAGFSHPLFPLALSLWPPGR